MKLQAILYLAGLAQACLLPHELEAERDLHLHGRHTSPSGRPAHRRQSDPGHVDFPIGAGDRFENGTTAPRGLGVDDRPLGSILNVGEVRTALQGLAGKFPDVKPFTAPFTTFENRSVYGAAIGDAPRVFIQSGIHARERGGPDNVLYFISDLLHARDADAGVTYGNKSYTPEQVVTALSAGVVIVPLVNPDGVAHDQATDTCWRKNRNTDSSTPGSPRTVGIDLNRNFNFLWDYEQHFSPQADLWAAASDNPSSEVFHGTGPFSEPETRNIAWLQSDYRNLSWFLDLHSYSADILYAWGDDDVQTTDVRQTFTNASYDGDRGILGAADVNTTYREYIAPADLASQRALSLQMSRTMSAAGDLPYAYMQSVSLYPTSGGSTDYTMSRYYRTIADPSCGVNRVHGLTIEFGVASASTACPFYPNDEQYHNSVRQVSAGLMELLLNAAGKDGEPVRREC
ncbi:hypothetical protein S7711_09269 [Stachybotrys chartarum IBT 7711]|uniref:Peptidase M14 domain-containing protein n=1 Tax=Stachybotrys chartarum (strain CBS 109288 / IBT 7711) TaxID=1280523 RepID=A0A084AW76_STACB|nr:hypothetical protein S7711_09269 [Stachybotrys chartarum IBT 7711]KFA49194.1 hypothetical protein S40293_07207 [Stachybotrys chartarum IBT 40293]